MLKCSTILRFVFYFIYLTNSALITNLNLYTYEKNEFLWNFICIVNILQLC
jgi:hypothetical protein